jgi:uncharacterized Zn finger protein
MGWGDCEWYPRTRPRKVKKGGIRARSRQGRIGKTWWSQRWLETLESYGWGNRLERGRRYARMGQVVSFELSQGKVEALVQGSRPKPYRVTIEVKQFQRNAWESVAKAMASKAIFASKLLAGEMPQNIEDAFMNASLTLFPGKREIRTDCSCPDDANPCKHIAATYYILAEEFDRDPFLVFLLRGRTKDGLIRELSSGRRLTKSEAHRAKSQRSQGEESSRDTQVPTLEDCLGSFWVEQRPLGPIRVSADRPYVDAAVIKRLGEPQFWREPEDFTKLMEEVYRDVTSRALELAFS